MTGIAVCLPALPAAVDELDPVLVEPVDTAGGDGWVVYELTGSFLAGPLADLLGARGASVALAATAILTVALLYFSSPVIPEIRQR